MIGRIIRIISNQYLVADEDGRRVECVAMGKVRLQDKPRTGDWVEYTDFGDQTGIERILPRKNSLIRPPVANVDQALIVMSAKDPDFSCTLMDRILFLIVNASIQPVLCITKMDLVQAQDPVHAWIEDYRRSGYEVVLSGREELDENLAGVLKDKVTVLTGQSGVGKSSLLNKLNPAFQLQTQEISKALGRGKHTTRHVELHEVAGGWVADTPGFSSLDFSRMTPTELAQSVPDFAPYLGKCRFRDCIHQNEPGCAIKQAVEAQQVSRIRYADYLDCLTLVQGRKEKY